MPDRVAAYPLLRARQRRRWRFPRATRRQGRIFAVLVLAAALVLGVAIARRPRAQSADELLSLSRQTLADGNYSAARRNGERAFEAAPRSAGAHLALARAELKLDQGLAAEAETQRAAELGAPAGAVRPLLAEAKLSQGDFAGALALAGSDPAAQRVRALALAAEGQGAVAQQVLVTSVHAAPADNAAWTALGRLRLVAGELAGAAEAAARAVHAAPHDPAALTLQGEVVRARYGLIAALPWFEAALKRDAYYSPALIQYAATLGDAGRYADALAATRKALAARPGSPPALYLQAMIAARAGKFDLAQRLLGSAGDAVAGLPGAVLLQGALDQAAGRREEAVARWKGLVAMQPMNIGARRLLGEALLRAGDPRGALDVLRPVALRGDADTYSLRLVGRAWEAVGARESAAAFLDRAAAGAGGGDGLFAPDEALGSLIAGAAGAPTDPTYALGVIRGYAVAGDHAQALAKAHALAAAASGAQAAQLALGDMLAATGDGRGAAMAYMRAADLQFDEPVALRLVDALARTGRAQQASRALALYLAQNPQSLVARRLLGRLQLATAAWPQAIETLEGVRRAGGNRDAMLLADLAVAYAGTDRGEVARRYGAAAYRLQPVSVQVCDAYGVALAADGALDAARQLLAKAAALAPADPVIAAHRRRLA